MKTIQLAAERIQRDSRASFARMACKFGLREAQLEDMLFDALQQSAHRAAKWMDDAPSDLSTVKANTLSILAAPSFWQALALNEAHMRVQYLEMIFTCHKLPIKVDYLRGIARLRGINVPADTNDVQASALILAEVPFVFLFENNFNAFFSEEALTDNLPGIVMYYQIPIALQIATQIILDVNYIESSIGVDRRSDSGAIERASSPYIIELVWVLKKILLGEIYRVKFRTAFASWLGRFAESLIHEYAERFVVAHEYGHLMLGHLERGPSHTVEYEADVFAAHVVMSNALKTGNEGECLMGIAIVFGLIDILSNGEESETHPRPLNRYMRVLRFLADMGVTEKPDQTSALASVGRALNPGLKETGFQMST